MADSTGQRNALEEMSRPPARKQEVDLQHRDSLFTGQVGNVLRSDDSVGRPELEIRDKLALSDEMPHKSVTFAQRIDERTISEDRRPHGDLYSMISLNRV